MNSTQPRVGLALTGGGARAAYQMGVLKGVSEILGEECVRSPFHCLTGISAGAINAAYLAASADCFREGVDRGCELWSGLSSEQILHTDVLSLGKLGTRWLRDLTLGGATGHSRSTHLLDTAPLHRLLESKIDFGRISRNLSDGTLHSFAVTATNYGTGTAITFFEGAASIEPWTRSSRLGRRGRIGLEHVLASAAIPILFQPVPLGGAFYGDGSIRMRAPLSPPIHLGADRILAIGIRYMRPDELTFELNERDGPVDRAVAKQITLADIAGVLLNAAFMDSLDADVERLERINQTVQLLEQERGSGHKGAAFHLRKLPLLVIRPSVDLGTLAAEQFDRFPRMLRYLLRGIGASQEKGWDLLSYLAFDHAYTSRLLELGRTDAVARAAEIRAFLTAGA